jgi:chemotaxis protein MotA
MLVLIGYAVVIFSVFGGFAMSGGHLYALFQPFELLIIGGAALGSFIVGNNLKIIKETFKASFSILKGSGYSKEFYVQLLSLFYELTNKIRKEGALSVESDIENYHESPLFSEYPLIQKDAKIMEFLCDHLKLIITGRVDIHHLEIIMENDIDTYEEEAELPINAINKVSDSMPAFGIVAAVMGVVHTMESIGIPPSQLGALIARALVGTFLGVLIGYGFTGPVATALDTKRQAVVKVLQSVKIVLLASTSNLAPTLAVELARKVLYASGRPNGRELEEILKNIKAKGVNATNG